MPEEKKHIELAPISIGSKNIGLKRLGAERYDGDNEIDRFSSANWENYGQNIKFDPYASRSTMENMWNENTTWWDDIKRATPHFGNLFALGFTSNVGAALDDEEFNLAEARKYEREVELGASTRDGMGAAFTNLYLNSGYTFGIMAEIAAEEVAMMAATALTEGASSGLLAARTATNLTRLGKAFKGLKAGVSASKKSLTNLDKLSDAKRALGAFSDIKDVTKAKGFWEGAKTTGNYLGKGALKIANPLDNLTDLGKLAYKGDERFKSLSNLAKVRKSFGAFYRDVRELNATYAESRLEGGMVYDDAYEALITEFKERNFGNEPSDAEKENLRKRAFETSQKVRNWNMPAIYLSNRITMGGLFKNFKPSKWIGSKVGVTPNVGDMVIDKATKKFVPKLTEINFSKVLNKETWKNLNTKFGVKPLLRGSIKYTKANFAEGIQELMQEAISPAAKQFAVDSYVKDTFETNKDVASFYSYLGHSGKELLGSEEGLGIFMSGFMMGGLVNVGTKAITVPYNVGRKKYQQRKRYEKLDETNQEEFRKKVNESRSALGLEKIEDDEIAKKYSNVTLEDVPAKLIEEVKSDSVKTVEALLASPTSYFAEGIEKLRKSAVINQEMEEALKNNDKKAFMDAHNVKVTDTVVSAIRGGVFDEMVSYHQDLLKLDDADLVGAIGEDSLEWDADKLRKNLKSQIENFNEIQKYYEAASDTIGKNPFNKYITDSTDPKQVAEYYNHLGFNQLVADMVYSRGATVNVNKRMDSLRTKMGDVVAFRSKNREANSLDNHRILGDQSLLSELQLSAQESNAALESIVTEFVQINKDGKEVSTALSKDAERILKEEDTLKRAEKIENLLNSERGNQLSAEVRSQLREQARKLKTLTNVKIARDVFLEILSKEEGAISEQDLQQANEDLKQSLREYFSALGTVNEEVFNKFYMDYVDLMNLEKDNEALFTRLNNLSSPEYQANFIKRSAAMYEGRFRNRKQDIEENLKAFKEKSETSSLLKTLLTKHQVFLSSEDAEVLEQMVMFKDLGDNLEEKKQLLYQMLNSGGEDNSPLEFLDLRSERPILDPTKIEEIQRTIVTELLGEESFQEKTEEETIEKNKEEETETTTPKDDSLSRETSFKDLPEEITNALKEYIKDNDLTITPEELWNSLEENHSDFLDRQVEAYNKSKKTKPKKKPAAKKPKQKKDDEFEPGEGDIGADIDETIENLPTNFMEYDKLDKDLKEGRVVFLSSKDAQILFGKENPNVYTYYTNDPAGNTLAFISPTNGLYLSFRELENDDTLTPEDLGLGEEGQYEIGFRGKKYKTDNENLYQAARNNNIKVMALKLEKPVSEIDIDDPMRFISSAYDKAIKKALTLKKLTSIQNEYAKSIDDLTRKLRERAKAEGDNSQAEIYRTNGIAQKADLKNAVKEKQKELKAFLDYSRIDVGDLVLTHKGEIKKVVAKDTNRVTLENIEGKTVNVAITDIDRTIEQNLSKSSDLSEENLKFSFDDNELESIMNSVDKLTTKTKGGKNVDKAAKADAEMASQVTLFVNEKDKLTDEELNQQLANAIKKLKC